MCVTPAILDDRVDRAAAVEAVGAFGAPDSKDALVRLLERPGDAKARAAAAWALRRYPDATNALIAALSSEDAPIRASAAKALARRPDQGAIVALAGRRPPARSRVSRPQTGTAAPAARSWVTPIQPCAPRRSRSGMPSRPGVPR
jgi:hypothetical protein